MIGFLDAVEINLKRRSAEYTFNALDWVWWICELKGNPIENYIKK